MRNIKTKFLYRPVNYPVISTRRLNSKKTTHRRNTSGIAYCCFIFFLCTFHIENTLKSLVSTNSTIAAAELRCKIS